MMWLAKSVAVFLMSVIILFAAEVNASAQEITLEGANLSFSPPDGWSVVYEGSMSESDLNVIGKSASTVKSEFSQYGGYLFGTNSNRTMEVFVTRTRDSVSERIYNSQTGNYQLISDYLNAPDNHNYMQQGRSVTVVRTSERILLDNCTFNAVEYTEAKGCGICYSTVVNGDYISVDFRRTNGSSFTDSEKIAIINSINTAKVLSIEEKETLSQNQIIILAGLALLLILLFAAIAVRVKRNK